MEKNEKLNSSGLLITGGTVVNSGSSVQASVAVKDGKIEAVGSLDPSLFSNYQILNATGKLLFPGGIDPHVHLALPSPVGYSTDDFRSGTAAALAGGTTSIIDFVTPRRGQSLVEALHLRQAEALASLCNWKLHLGISEWTPKVKAEVIHCIRHEGIRSIKAYLAYHETIGIRNKELHELMVVVAAEGGIVLVHCEDYGIIQQIRQQFLAENKTRACFHALSRPPQAEINAIRQVITLSAATGCPAYIVHVSTAEGAELIRRAKQDGLPIMAETCIQYLTLNDSVYNPALPDHSVLPFVISPPIRSEENRIELWNQLAAGTFDTVATDHCPFNLKGQKEMGIDDFTKIPNGAGGIEYRLPLLYAQGVATGLITPQQFVSLTSSQAAGIFGWGQYKGSIAHGYDADIVVWNPSEEWTISRNNQHQQCDSNIYEGAKIKGIAETVILGGKVQ